MTSHRSMDWTSQTDRQTVTPDAPSPVVATGPSRKPARVTLDFATWRARIAAPGSRFEPAQPASPRIVHLDAASRAAAAVDAERRTA
jgi:hypothetical protein